MNLFHKEKTRIIPAVTIMLFLAVVLFAGQGVSQQIQTERLPENGGAVYDGTLEFGPGPMCFDHLRQGPVLTVDEVRAGLERWLMNVGNPRLKVGNVTEKDSQTITADIVTGDNSLVEKFDIDRHTGIIWQLQQPGGWISRHWGAHGGMAWGHGMHGWMIIPFFGMFFFFLMIILVVMLISSFFRHRPGGWREMESHDLSSLDALNKRYAGGQIGGELRRESRLVRLSALAEPYWVCYTIRLPD
jgi:uncharacterized membrane protein